MATNKTKDAKCHYIYVSNQIWDVIKQKYIKWDAHNFLNILSEASELLMSCKTCYERDFLKSFSYFKKEKRLKVVLAKEEGDMFSYEDLVETAVFLNNNSDISYAIHPFLFILFIVGPEIHYEHSEKMNVISATIKSRSRFRYIP